MKKLNYVTEKINAKAFKTFAYINLMMATLIAGMSPVFADQIGAAAEQAAKGIQSSAMSAVKWVIMIILVIGGFVFLGLGGHQAKENAKANAWEKLLGIALIILALPISGLIFGWFK